MNEFSGYRVMWIFIFFDLPTETRKERKDAATFRKELIKDGFSMFQFSIYIRHCSSKENADVHVRRVKKILPEYGNVGIITITDKQFSTMELFNGKKSVEDLEPTLQLELF
ncbi:MAG: CRISPR-associated endonuclease Cas2 [Rikenellaceae bacterium]